MQISLEKRELLAGTIKAIHAYGWARGTGGNFSVKASEHPFALIMSPSGADKGSLTIDDLIVVNEKGLKVEGKGNPSAETLLHLAILEKTDAKAVLHTHSVWNTILSDYFFKNGSIVIEGLEMLKGLSGVSTHDHKECVPILENSQDIPKLAEEAKTAMQIHKGIHGFLLRNHGLYTWGRDIFEAKRHVEIFEFLFEVVGRKILLDGRR